MNNRFSTLLIAGAVAASMIATSAFAQPAPGKTELSTSHGVAEKAAAPVAQAAEKASEVQPAKSVSSTSGKKAHKGKKGLKKHKGGKAKATSEQPKTDKPADDKAAETK